MSRLKSLFVVIDPVSENQRALQRALHITRISPAHIHAYVCIYSEMENDDPDMLKQVEIERQRLWLEKMLAPYREEHDISYHIDWDKDWRAATARAARESKCDIVIKATHPRPLYRQLFYTSSDRAVLEICNSPVLLVSMDEPREVMKVLVAVDLHRQDGYYNSIMKQAVGMGKDIINYYQKGELHIVNAYETSEDYVHPTDIAKNTGVDFSSIHVVGGKPEFAIGKVAEEIDASLVIVGTSTRNTLMQRLSSYVADALPNYINHDILVIKPAAA